jgi:hypothetical protein
MSTHRLISLPVIHHVLTFVLANRAGYKWGAKIEPLTNHTPTGVAVDCSGFTRWAIYQASGGKVIIPDGSTGQREWCETMGFEKVPYSQAINDKTNAIYMCFAWKVRPGERHVWLVRLQRSWESWSKHGPGVRSAKTLWHRLNCRACYRITTE